MAAQLIDLPARIGPAAFATLGAWVTVLPARAGTADAPCRRAVGSGWTALAGRAAADPAGDPGGLCQLLRLIRPTCFGSGAFRSSGLQNTECNSCPAHIVKAPCGSGNVLAHARSRAQKVPEFVVTVAIPSCRCDALEAEHRPTSALDATMVLLKTIVEIAVSPMPHAAAELRPDRPGIGVVAIRRDPIGDHCGDGLGRPKEALGCRQVAVIAEHHVDQGTVTIDRTIQVLPTTVHLPPTLPFRLRRSSSVSAGVSFVSQSRTAS